MLLFNFESKLNLQAGKEVNPHIMTIATLTGHAVVAVGTSYSVRINFTISANDRFF